MKIEVHGNFKMRKKGFNIAITMWIYVHTQSDLNN